MFSASYITFLYLFCFVEHPGRKGRKDDDNPFSFKKFLQGGPPGNNRPGGPHGIANLDLANDLPDFVQDHYPSASVSDSSRRPRNPHIPDAPLPDFALDSESGVQTPPFIAPELLPEGNNEAMVLDNLNLGNLNLGSGARPRINNVNLLNDVEPRLSASEEGDSDSDSIEALPQPNNSSGQLPDFLSDNVIRPTCGAGSRPSAGHPVENGVNGLDLHSHSPDFVAGPGESETELNRVSVRTFCSAVVLTCIILLKLKCRHVFHTVKRGKQNPDGATE